MFAFEVEDRVTVPPSSFKSCNTTKGIVVLLLKDASSNFGNVREPFWLWGAVPFALVVAFPSSMLNARIPVAGLDAAAAPCNNALWWARFTQTSY